MKYIKIAALVLCGALGLCAMGCSVNATGTSVTTEATTETTKAPVTNEGDEFVGDYPAFEVTTTSLKGNMWEDRMGTANISPALSWEPVEGASCYVIYMVDLNANCFLHWVQGDITETSLPQGFAGSKYYIGMYPPPGDTHVYNIYVIALKNPVERVKGSVNGISPKFPDFINALDTDKDGNTGNIISVGKVSGKFIGK
ncbi:MAG: hypothetical protein J6W36_01250 [Clostridiales bacterium]|nr:hypothetical protein [Clostridiales bacterium]